MLIRAQKQYETSEQTYYNSAFMRKIYIIKTTELANIRRPDGYIITRYRISAVFGKKDKTLAVYTTKQQAEDELERFRIKLCMGAASFQFADDEPEYKKESDETSIE